MIEHKIHFLGEKDYIPVMETQNRLWREQHVKNGKITTRDGIRLNYYHAEHPHPKAVVVILHGYCGFWGKYHEFAWYLWQAGYTIFFLEQRCHGYSGGKLPEYDVVHIDTFDTYVKDLREFMEMWSTSTPLTLMLRTCANLWTGWSRPLPGISPVSCWLTPWEALSALSSSEPIQRLLAELSSLLLCSNFIPER